MALSQFIPKNTFRPHILVLEENSKLHPHFKRLELDFKISVVSGISQALERAKLHDGNRPDIVIIDVLQGRSRRGLKIGRELQQIDRRVPIMLLTKEGSEEFALGVCDLESTTISKNRLISSNSSKESRTASNIAFINRLRNIGLPRKHILLLTFS